VAPLLGLSTLGLARFVEGDDAGAEADLEEATMVAGSLGNRRLVALADHHLGQLARHRGDIGQAEDLHHEALAHQARGKLRPAVAESLEALATLAADHESYGEATRLLGAASSLRRSIGFARWPVDQAGYDAELVRCREGLGEVSFEAAWSEGEALGVDEVVAYASRARGERKRPSAGWASLTPTELEVVKLAAKGLTNPEIGERMFIGRGTVKTHLAHVFAKLGLTSRAQLAAEATRQEAP